ncbi:hypothetical protein [Spirosoma areae]
MGHFAAKRSAYWLTLTLGLMGPHAHGQRPPFEGANVILITTDLADKQTYQAITQVLTEQSITFSAASDGLLLNSSIKPVDGHQTIVFAGQVSVRSGLVKLTGRLYTPEQVAGEDKLSAGQVLPIAYSKRKNSLQRAGFLYLNELAKKLQAHFRGVIFYKVEQNLAL